MAGFNVRKEMPGVELSRDEFRKRYNERRLHEVVLGVDVPEDDA